MMPVARHHHSSCSPTRPLAVQIRPRGAVVDISARVRPIDVRDARRWWVAESSREQHPIFCDAGTNPAVKQQILQRRPPFSGCALLQNCHFWPNPVSSEQRTASSIARLLWDFPR